MEISLARRELFATPRAGIRDIEKIAVPFLIAVLPIHALAVDLGFSLKLWLLALGITCLCLTSRLWREATGLPLVLRGGMVVTLICAAVGAASSSVPVIATRHGLAVALGLLLAVAIVAARPSPATLGTAIRLSAIVMSVAALLESAVLLANGLHVGPLVGISGLVEPLGDVVYGDIPVAHALHVDSNFAALYAVVWLMLVAATPSVAPFGRKTTAVVAGLLLLTILVAFSRSGAIALVAGLVVVMVGLFRGQRPSRTSLAVGIAVVGLGVGCLLAVDSIDGRSHLQAAAAKRVTQVRTEVPKLFGLLQDLPAFVRQTAQPSAAVVTPANTAAPQKTAAAQASASRAGSTARPGTSSLPQATTSTGQLSRNTAAPSPAPQRTANATARPSTRPAERSDVWRQWLILALASPLIGVGFGAGAAVVGSYGHNALLEAWAGGGVLALAGLASLWLATLIFAVRNARREPRQIYVLAAVVSFLVASMFMTTNYEPLPGFLMGLVLISGSRVLSPR